MQIPIASHPPCGANRADSRRCGGPRRTRSRRGQRPDRGDPRHRPQAHRDLAGHAGGGDRGHGGSNRGLWRPEPSRHLQDDRRPAVRLGVHPRRQPSGDSRPSQHFGRLRRLLLHRRRLRLRLHRRLRPGRRGTHRDRQGTAKRAVRPQHLFRSHQSCDPLPGGRTAGKRRGGDSGRRGVSGARLDIRAVKRHPSCRADPAALRNGWPREERV